MNRALPSAVAKRRSSRGPFGRNSVRPLSIAPRSRRTRERPRDVRADQRVVVLERRPVRLGDGRGCRGPAVSAAERRSDLRRRARPCRSRRARAGRESTSTAASTSISAPGRAAASVPNSSAHSRATIATSLSRSSDGGARRPREACTAPIESSTVTRCSPPPRRSRSVRPRVGRMIARRPVTTCERLSFVETCTVRSVLRSAASVDERVGGGGDEVAAHAHEDARGAVAHRADRLDGVVAVLARRGERELAIEGVEERGGRLLVDAHRAVALHVRVTAHRADAGARATDVALQQQHVHDVAQRRPRSACAA